MNIPQPLLNQLLNLAQQHNAEKITLFGSRARGTHKHNSDIDLAVYGMPTINQSHFWLDVQDMPSLLKFDIVFITDTTNKSLIYNIIKDGVTIYEKN